MEALQENQQGTEVWVGNAGLGGENTVGHLAFLETLPVLKTADLLIFMIGGNDFLPALAFKGAPTQEILEANTHAFRRTHSTVGPRFRRVQLLRYFWAQRRLIEKNDTRDQDGGGDWYNRRRQERAAGPIVPMPDLGIALEEYTPRVRNISNWCQGHGIRCLYLTQPTIWREDLESEAAKLMFTGNVGTRSDPDGYLYVGDLAKGMDSYNQALLDLCSQDGLECFDIAQLIPKDMSAFYDDMHFNEAGAQMVANRIADYLLTKAPFVGP